MKIKSNPKLIQVSNVPSLGSKLLFIHREPSRSPRNQRPSSLRKDRMDRLIKCNELIGILGVSRSTIDRMEKRGELPKRVRVSSNRIGWLESDIQQHFEKLKAGNQLPTLAHSRTWRAGNSVR